MDVHKLVIPEEIKGFDETESETGDLFCEIGASYVVFVLCFHVFP
jgi:hypothetical protein